METSATRRPVVLIVEDESVLRTNAADVIGDAGFDVPLAKPVDPHAVEALLTARDA